jgi:hypothetical protein
MKLPLVSIMTTTAATTTSRGILLRPVARNLLEDRQYNIEFYGFLSNHAKHAIIALDRLAAPEERVQEYWDDYTNVTPYSIALEKVDPSSWDPLPIVGVDESSSSSSRSLLLANKWKDTWRGRKIQWQEQVVFMNQELERLHHDTNQLVQLYAPDLIVSGMAGSLTHGIIHLGWAIDAQSPWMITEGLAYLNFGHLGIDPSLLSWQTEKNDDADATINEIGPMDSLIRVANIFESENLKTTWIDRVKAMYDSSFHPELVCAGFQWELSKVLAQPHAVATQMPSWLSLSSDKLWQEMYYATVYLYLATRSKDPPPAANGGEEEMHGNFLVLHLLTSLCGLEQTVKAIAAGAATCATASGSDTNTGSSSAMDTSALTRKALGQFYATVVCLLATSVGGFPSASALKDIQQEFPATLNDKNVDWEPTVQRGIAEQEEHNIKLVYIMKELWNRYHHWNGFYQAANAFTLTPNLGPVDPKEKPGFKA